MLVEVHILQNHAPSNLNRDDTGSPKEAFFGGHKRARISSQCLKRSIRRSPVYRDAFDPLWRERPLELSDTLAFRTRKLPDLVKAEIGDKPLGKLPANHVVSMVKLFGKLGKQAKIEGEGEDGEPDEDRVERSAQAMFLMRSEVQAVLKAVSEHLEWESNSKELEVLQPKNGKNTRAYLTAVAAECTQADADSVGSDGKKPKTKKLSAQSKGTLQDLERRVAAHVDKATVDIALFGRMVTSDAFLDVEASSQFAHAISTHKINHEFDYYTAVDDLERASDDAAGGGADMIGDVEFNSACYYKYFNVHVEGLLDNLTGKAFKREVSPEGQQMARETAGLTVRTLIEAACRVTPTGKQNTFAAHQVPSLVWIEIRDRNLPVSYANAFCDPVNAKSGNGLELNSAEALKREVECTEKMYGLDARMRCLLTKHDDFQILDVKGAANLTALLDSVETEVTNG